MKKRLFWVLLSCMIIVAMVLSSCGTSTTETTSAPSTMPTISVPTTQGSQTATTATAWWSKFGTPQYGGSITVRTTYLRNEQGNNSWLGWGTRLQYEDLFVYDWTTDPAKWNFAQSFVPWDYRTGMLAKSWETPDDKTWIFHLQEGVHYANRPPVNGRELTSADIVKHYERTLGTGGGYTAGLPMFGSQAALYKGAQITAVDKYTVKFVFAKSVALNVMTLVNETGLNQIEAPETVTPDKPLPDPLQCIGTGAWILNEFTSESAATFVKNPDYWRYDPRYPNNKLPYVDEVKLLSIPDIATAMAGLRTGKIDYLDGLFPEQASTVLKSNPELLDSKQVYAGPSIEPRNDLKPFSDIRVRQAMQLSLDLAAIDKAFYANEVPPYPCGPINSAYSGFMIPYAEWSQSLKDEYAYNPTKAKQLLADAGYANGFDTTIQADGSQGMDLLQAINGYFKAVGINAVIEPMDTGTLSDVIAAGKHTIRFDYGGRTGTNTTPWQALGQRLTGAVSNENKSSDPKFDAMYNLINSTPSYAEAVKTCIEADQYALTQHWGIFTFPIYKHTVYQPYLKGYNGQLMSGSSGRYPGPFYSMLWIDQTQKKNLGR